MGSIGPYRTIAEVPVGLDPEGIAVDAGRRRAYVACSRSDVTLVDLAAAETVAAIELAAGACAVGVVPTGRPSD